MSLSHNAAVVTNGLIFYYDMNNTKKSWLGAPSTNIFRYSSSIANWNKSPGINTIIDNAATAPDGTMTASLVTANGTTNSYISSGDSVVTGNTYTKSVYAKAVSTNILVFETYDNNGAGGIAYFSTTFDLSAGTVTGTASGDTATITNVGNGWYRCSTTRAQTLSTGAGTFYIGAYGTGTGSVYLWMPQLEIGSFATPPIVTGAATASRSTSQAITDLTNSSTITAGGLVYNSDNTFNFIYSNPSYVQVPLATAFNKLYGSINVWIYPTSYNGGNGIFVNRTDSTANATDWLWIGPYSGTFYFRIGDGTTCCNNDNAFGNYYSIVPVNTWTNLCCTWSSSGTSCVYINGKLYQSRAISAIPSTNPDTNGRFGLGHANADSYFNGKMPVAQIYNRQLTEFEVLQNFNALRQRYGI